MVSLFYAVICKMPNLYIKSHPIWETVRNSITDNKSTTQMQNSHWHTPYKAIELHSNNTQKLGNILYQNAQPIPRKGKFMLRN